MTNDNLIACIVEGTAERVIMNKLLENDKLIFSKADLLDQELLKCRSPKQFEERYLGKSFKSKISVYRILDSRSEEFRLRKIYANKVDVINVITAPEIEILVIIEECISRPEGLSAKQWLAGKGIPEKTYYYW